MSNSKNSNISIIQALAVTLALKITHFFSSHNTLAHDDAPPDQVWLQNVQQFKRYREDKIQNTDKWFSTSDSKISQDCSAAAPSAYRPAACQQNLPIHLHRGAATELSPCQVSVVRGVDKVVTKWLVHVHVNVQTVQEHRSILIRHQVTTKSIHAQPLWKKTQV